MAVLLLYRRRPARFDRRCESGSSEAGGDRSPSVP